MPINRRSIDLQQRIDAITKERDIAIAKVAYPFDNRLKELREQLVAVSGDIPSQYVDKSQLMQYRQAHTPDGQ